HALADAAAGEEPDPLAAADGQERVDRAHADVERLADRRPLERIDGLGDERRAMLALERPAAVERLAGAVDDAAEEAVADPRLEHPGGGHDARAGPDPVQRADRHQEQRVVREADDLRLGRTSVLADDEAARADGRLAADRLERHAGHARQHAVRNETVPGADTVAEPREARAPTAAALRRGALDGERSRHPGGAPSPASADAAGPVSASPAS